MKIIMKYKRLYNRWIVVLFLLSMCGCASTPGNDDIFPIGGQKQSLAALTQCLENESCGWSREEIDNDAESPDNDAGSVHISYNSTDGMDTANNTLKYATRDTDGEWIITTVDYGGVGWYSSLKVGPQDYVHISYYDIINQSLKYATNVTGAWEAVTVDSISSDVGWSTSLGIDSNYNIHITYYDANIQSLKYATNMSGTWIASTIDSTADVGWSPSLAIDESGVVDSLHIAYPDDTNGTLKYATNTRNGLWDTYTIDQIGSSTYLTGFYLERITAIDVDADGYVHIAYYDIVNSDLKYATNVSGSWVTSTLDATGDIGSATSIETYSDGTQKVVLIFYFDSDNSKLKYAINTSGGEWVTSTPGITGTIGAEPAVSVSEGDGEIHVTSMDPANIRVVYTPPSP